MKGQLVVITIEKGKAKIKTYNITSNKMYIGRTEDNDIVVNTQYASHHHGILQEIAGELYYADLNSVNGTYCNDKLVEKTIGDNMHPVCLKNHANLFIGDFENKEGCYIYYSKDTDENIRWKVARRGEVGILNSSLPRVKVGIVNIYAVVEEEEKTFAKSKVPDNHWKKEIVPNRNKERTQEDSFKDTPGTLVVISVDESNTYIGQFLLKANNISIGRQVGTANCDIQIKNAVISKEQALIEKINGKYYYTEKGSNRFSLIGARKGKIPFHQRIQLYDRDIMSIGSIVEGRAVILYFSTNIYDNYSWKIKKLNKETIYIGRSQENFICLPQLSVSRRHAKIFVKNNHRILEDTKSSNGVLLNKKVLNHGMILQSGDEIDIVNNKIIYLEKYLLYAVPQNSLKEQPALKELKNSAGQLEKHSYKGGIEVELNHISRIVPCKKGTGINGGNKKYILQDISLKIPAGQLVAILGGSGAGKTTFMNCVNGFEPATEGTVKINGKELYSNYAALKSRIGYVPQQDIVHEDLTLESMLKYVAKLRLPGDLSKEEINSKVDEVIQIVDLKPHAKTYIKKLSGGQKKRASIAVELLSDPELFFLDEPTSGLDPEAETNLMKRLKVLSSNRGKTVLVITHTLQNIHLFDKVIFLAPGGKLCFYGSPREALEFFKVENLSDAYEKIGQDVEGYVNKYKRMKEAV